MVGSNNAFESVWIHTLLAEVTLRRNHIQAAKYHLGSAFAPGWTAHSASYALNTCVALAAQEHQYDHATVLLGAADAIRIAYRTPLPPADYDPYRQLMLLLQSMLSQEQHTQAYFRGQILPVEEAIVQSKSLLICNDV